MSKIAYGLQRNESESFMKKPLKECSRTLLANKSFCGVGTLIMEENTLTEQQIIEKAKEYTTHGTEENTPHYRIRKLTPKECGRLQGLKDEDINILQKNQSNASCYHLYGDSICVPVIMAIFSQMLDKDYTHYLDFENWYEK